MASANTMMWNGLRFTWIDIAYPDSVAPKSERPISRTMTIVGAWVLAAMVRVVVMSNIWFKAGSTRMDAPGWVAFRVATTQRDQISSRKAALLARAAFEAARSGIFSNTSSLASR